ncbi:hypothetical protein TeGR_g5845 [Tetraparma gracilis]|jgi:hypothetical protein|uniref:DUF4334 domain-containing protein n=1 Tax=Tetraparma gracilis TaxID=2962635 RepID=A0ABQ6N0A4_9STRA|nr:hypothetical protein TeGR_g5845 [Tetraparma gracilis]
MKWVGKTVHSQDLVSMLEFGAVNCVPLPTFTLGPVSTATVVRTDVDGKESLALAYNYLPIVDHIRRLDKDTIIGKMMIGKVTVLYFTLKCKE